MIKVVFFGTSQISVSALEALISDSRFDVVGVVTEPEKKKGRGQSEAVRSPVYEVAKKHGIRVFTPRSIKKDEDAQKEINSLGADVYVVIAYGKIIPSSVFDSPVHGTVNVHYSLLPELRGPSPIQGALLDGRSKTGVTLMQIDEEMDHGPILSQEEVLVAPDDTFLTLVPRLNDVGVKMLLRDLPRYVSGEVQPREQNHEGATYCKMISKDDGHIDWSESAETIYNKWRAFIVWPGLYTFLPAQAGANGKRFNLKDIQLSGSNMGNSVGTMYTHDKKLYVKCGKEAIEILEIQPEGKRPTSAESFINGYKHLLGTRLT